MLLKLGCVDDIDNSVAVNIGNAADKYPGHRNRRRDPLNLSNVRYVDNAVIINISEQSACDRSKNIK